MPLVSFDVWGTLLNVDVFYSSAAKALGEITGIPHCRAEELLKRAYREVKAARLRKLIDDQDVVGSSIRVAVEGGQLPFTAYDLKWAFARAANTVDPRLLPLDGVFDVLQTLTEMGFKLAVTSNVVFWPGALTRALMDQAGLSKFFRIQVYADEVRSLKPDPRIFTEVLRAANASPEEAAHVGDSPQEDLAGALASNIAGILISRAASGTYLDETLRIAVVKSLAEVPRAVSKLVTP